MRNIQSRVIQAIQHTPLETLVENRSVFEAKSAELNVYQTLRQAHAVSLQFSAPVLASMIEGKKVMHLGEKDPFEFLPGESVVLPTEEEMIIDFPEATQQQPTRCLALAIAPECIESTTNFLNERYPRVEDNDSWELNDQNYHLTHDRAIQHTMDRLIYYFTEDHPDRDVFVGHALQELVLRLMQTQARHLLVDQSQKYAHSHRIAFVVEYIRENLHQDMSIEMLCEKACLSRPHFFRCFKNELGFTPTEFVNRCRIERACTLLRDPRHTITEVCYTVGFNSLSYFNRVFKKMTQQTPQQYQKQRGK